MIHTGRRAAPSPYFLNQPRRRGLAVTGMVDAGASIRPSAIATPMAGQMGRRGTRVICRAW